MSTQNGLKHARCGMSMGMNMKHGNGHAACTWTCSMDMDMQHKHGHAAWTWTCSMSSDIEMQHGHGHAAWTYTWCWLGIVVLF